MDKKDFFNEIISFRDRHKTVVIQNEQFCCMVETPLFTKDISGVKICNQGHFTGEANAVCFDFNESDLADIKRKEDTETVEYIVDFVNGNKLELRIV